MHRNDLRWVTLLERFMLAPGPVSTRSMPRRRRSVAPRSSS